MDGVLRCGRYAFGPNRLHYCGPDANNEMFSYIREGFSDPGLEALLKQFQTMYPYLTYIAHSNNIRDPFDERVVEAYWIGNSLLENINKKAFWRHLAEDHRVKDKIGPRPFETVAEKIKLGALPHHSFHVFNIWKRTGHFEEAHTLESMDSCRISWGTVTKIDGPGILVKAEPLMFANGKLGLGEIIEKQITRQLESDISIDELKTGDLISFHWDSPCEIISHAQAANLKQFTLQSIRLANISV